MRVMKTLSSQYSPCTPWKRSLPSLVTVGEGGAEILSFPSEYLLDGLVEAKGRCLYCRSLVAKRENCTQCGAPL